MRAIVGYWRSIQKYRVIYDVWYKIEISTKFNAFMIRARNGKKSERFRKLKIFPLSMMIWEIIICMFI